MCLFQKAGGTVLFAFFNTICMIKKKINAHKAYKFVIKEFTLLHMIQSYKAMQKIDSSAA